MNLVAGAYIPGQTYPAISITGKRCSLMCDYCKAHYLKGMLSAPSPSQLYKLAGKLWERGAKGLLISGGFDSEGKLPIQRFLPTIRGIKEDFNLIISVHPGIVSRQLARALKEAKVDIVDYEFLVDPTVICEVMHLKRSKKDFLKGLKFLMEEGPPYVAPHIPIGFHYGKINMEHEALEELLDFDPYILIFIIYTPTKGTPMELTPPPPIKGIVALLQYARRKFNGEIALGCMRPPEYKEKLDEIILNERLVDRIAVPRWQVIEKYGLRRIPACCSVPSEFLSIFE